MGASNAVSVLATLDDHGVVDGLKKIKLSIDKLKDEDGKLAWSGIAKGGDATAALAEGVKRSGSALTLGVTAPLVAAGGAASAMAAGFDDAMSQVSGALGDPSADMEGLRQLALQLGADTVFSATEAGNAMVELAKGGMTEADIKGGALAASMDLAAAGGLNLADAASTTVQMMGSFGLGAGDAARIADALAGAANASSADVSDLTQAMSQCSAQAALAGWSLEDTSAALALFADHGVKGSDAGTSLKTMLQRLAAPTQEAATAMAALGLEVRDSDGSMKDVGSIAGELQGKLGGLSEAQRDAALQTIFGSDASRAAAIMMQAGTEGLQKYRDATADSTAAEEMASAQKGDLSWAIENMQGALESASIVIGDRLAPVIEGAATLIGNMAQGFSELPGPVQTAIVAAGGLLAVLGPVLMVAGAILGALPAISEGMAVLGGAFAVPLGPAAAVVGAIAGVIAVLVACWNESAAFRDAVTGAVGELSQTVQGVIDFLAPYIQQFAQSAMGVIGSLMDTVVPVVAGALAVIIDTVVPALGAILQTVGSVFGTILATVSSIMDSIKMVIDGTWNVIKGIFDTVVGLIVGIVTGDFSQMQSGVGSILTGMSQTVGGIMQGISSVVSGIWNGLVGIVTGVCNTISGAVGGAFDGISRVIGDVMGTAKDVVSGSLDRISGFFKGLHLEFPKIKLPHFSIQGEFSLKPPSVPHLGIDWYQTGAIATGPSVIGIGEAGPEAVVPLSGRHMDPYADAVARRLGELQGGRAAGGPVQQTIIFKDPVKRPEDVARAARMFGRYGLAGQT